MELYVKDKGYIGAEFYGVKNRRENKDSLRLLRAIEYCKKTGTTLVIGKLDQLLSEAPLLTTLLDSKVDFVFAFMPNFHSLAVDNLLANAQQLRGNLLRRGRKKQEYAPWNPTYGAVAKTSEGNRTASRKVMQKKKPQHTVEVLHTRGKGKKKTLTPEQERAKKHPANVQAASFAASGRKEGLSYHKIAYRLNAEGYRTRYGNKFTAIQVWRLLNTELHQQE